MNAATGPRRRVWRCTASSLVAASASRSTRTRRCIRTRGTVSRRLRRAGRPSLCSTCLNQLLRRRGSDDFSSLVSLVVVCAREAITVSFAITDPSSSRAHAAHPPCSYMYPPRQKLKRNWHHQWPLFVGLCPDPCSPRLAPRCVAVFATLSRWSAASSFGAVALGALRFFRAANLARGGANSGSGQYR